MNAGNHHPYHGKKAMKAIQAVRSFVERVLEWASSPKKTSPSKPAKATTTLAVESMETRDCMTSVQAFANVLDTALYQSVRKLVVDSATVIAQKPTAMANTLVKDLVRIHNHNQAGRILNVFAEFQTFGRNLAKEAIYVALNKYPRSSALLANPAVQKDLIAISKLKNITFSFVRYIAATTQNRSTTSTSYVFTTGLFAPSGGSGSLFGGSSSPFISDQLQSVLAKQYQNALVSYSGPTLKSYDNYYKSLTGSLVYNSQFSWLARNVNPNQAAGTTNFVY